MKKNLLILALSTLGVSSMFGQLSQVVNEYYGTRATGEDVYRIYAELTDPTDFVSAVFGANNDVLYLGSDVGGIVNDGLGAITGDVLSTGLCAIVADLCLDSYITIGHAGSPTSGTTVYWDDTTPIPCGQGVIAISTQPSSSVFPDSFAQVNGADLNVTDGSWFSTNLPGCNDQGIPFGMNNRVLLAQVAVPVGGTLEYCLNIQIFNEALGSDNLEYVWDPATVDAGQVDGSCIGLCQPSNCTPDVLGCMDTIACNYDSTATADDGSCTYPGCMDTTACNYDAAAGCDDGSCVLLEQWFIPLTISGPAVFSCLMPDGYQTADQACVEYVISIDPFCLDTSWDGLCQTEYDNCVNPPGCMDTNACNYDSTAVVDDGSCTYPGCMDTTACNYDAVAGCDDGSCVLLEQWFIPLTISGPAVFSCLMPDGYQTADQACVEYVISIDPFCLDTSWDSICQGEYDDCVNPPGCIDTTACNYDPLAVVDDGSCTYPGCTDVTACNYDSTAACEDGSCNYVGLWYIPLVTGDGPAIFTCAMPAGYQNASQPCVEYVIANDPFCVDTSWDGICQTEYDDCVNSPGCTDPSACNYDSLALLDDGSCTYPGCTDSTACNYDPLAGCDDGSCILLEQWFIPLTVSGPAVFSCLMPDGYQEADQACVEYVISIDPFCVDTAWDGVCQSEYDDCVNPPGCIDTTACNYDPLAVVDDGSCTYPGCMDASACNYDSTAGCDDGSCTYPGCTDVTACNYDIIAACDDGSCILPDGCTNVDACNYNPTSLCDDGSCIMPDGCTDPLACNYDSTAQCDDGSCMLPDGCSNPSACNYDPTALCDDGSCILPDGCTDMMACNYDSTALCDDGSCVMPDGCTDPLACNYDSTAMCDDGSCILPDGCTDMMACNYDSTAMCDDGSCIMPDGCTDMMACNYDSTASCDDGSCILPDGCTNIMACNYDSTAACDDGSCIMPDGCTDATACNYDPNALCDDGSCATAPADEIISGNTTPGEGSTVTYTYPDTAGSTYNWTVTNGTIISGQGTSAIEVEWGPTGPGTVTVVETNNAGCDGNEATLVIDVVTGISELETTSFVVYPNPARDHLVVEPLNNQSDMLFVKLYDGVGKLVLTHRINGKTVLDIQGLANGVYTVVLTGNDSISTSRVIIER